MQVIGIMGHAGAGKHAVAGMLAAALNDRGHTVKLDVFGAPIKREIVAAEGGLDKALHRRTMQHMATAMREQDENYFVRALAERNNIGTWDWFRSPAVPPQADFLIIPDVRYENEAVFCRETGVLVKVRGSHRPLEGAEAAHASETLAASENFSADYTIPRVSSLGKLAAAVEALVAGGHHLRAGTRRGAVHG